MELALAILGLLFVVVGVVCHIIILIHAFKSSVGTGFLCLCVPCYILYYMFNEFEHEKKGLIIAGYFIGAIVGNCLLRAPDFMHTNRGYGGGYGGYGN